MGARPCLDFSEKLPRLCAGADVCLWYSNAPFEYCGMLFAAFTLRSENMAASAINVCERGFPSVQDALCAAPAGSFTDSRRYPDMGLLSEKWQKIASENGFLRIWDSGGIRSAGEDFFDKLLLKYMEKFSDTEQAALAAHGEYSAKAALFNIYFLLSTRRTLIASQAPPRHISLSFPHILSKCGYNPWFTVRRVLTIRCMGILRILCALHGCPLLRQVPL